MRKVKVFFGYHPDGTKIEAIYLDQLAKISEQDRPKDYKVFFYTDWKIMLRAIKKEKPRVILLPEMMPYDQGLISYENAQKELLTFLEQKELLYKVMLNKVSFEKETIPTEEAYTLTRSYMFKFCFSSFHRSLQGNDWLRILDRVVGCDYRLIFLPYVKRVFLT